MIKIPNPRFIESQFPEIRIRNPEDNYPTTKKNDGEDKNQNFQVEVVELTSDLTDLHQSFDPHLFGNTN